MLIRFSVENFLSFKDMQSFSMAAGRQTRHRSHVMDLDGHRVLKGGFFFGANAAGKSNLIQAISFARMVIREGTESIGLIGAQFRIDPDAIHRPGVFQFDLYAGGHFYSYGFALSYKTGCFEREWLYLCDKEDELIFERELIDGKTRIEKAQRFGNESISMSMRFTVYSEDVPQKKTFLSEIAEHTSNVEGFEDFIAVWNWLTRIVVITPDSRIFSKKQLLKDVGGTEPLKNLLASFDTGICDILEKECPIDQTLADLPDMVRADISKEVSSQFAKAEEDGTSIGSVTVGVNGQLYEFKKQGDEILAAQLQMNHGNPNDLFDLSDESDGTRRLFDLLPLYRMEQPGRVILIDELDRSFHSRLTTRFIEEFYAHSSGYNAQLIVTTHDASIMDLDLLRQDEIWFVERQEDHSSKIYPLNQFHIRPDKRIDKDYLLGRYGAIPCFSQYENKEGADAPCP